MRHDKKCSGQVPPGAPKLEPPKPSSPERVRIKVGDVLTVKAKAAYSCVDDPNTPEILATGNMPFYVVAEVEPFEGQYVRKDKTEVVGS